ncbi:hypothetical protein X777_00971, partial [Ooceraea biroi]
CFRAASPIIMLTFQFSQAIVLSAAIFLVCAHPTRRQEVRPLCVGCGDECDKCEFGFTISALCGIPECRRVSKTVTRSTPHNCVTCCLATKQLSLKSPTENNKDGKKIRETRRAKFKKLNRMSCLDFRESKQEVKIFQLMLFRL